MSTRRAYIDEMIETAAEGKQFSQLLSSTGISLLAAPVFSQPSAAALEDEAFYFTWGGRCANNQS